MRQHALTKCRGMLVQVNPKPCGAVPVPLFRDDEILRLAGLEGFLMGHDADRAG